ncbi:MAG: hypothetical protein Q9194_003440 [Teloschistes cf. exilis]
MAANKAPGIGKPSTFGAYGQSDTEDDSKVKIAGLCMRLSNKGTAGAAVIAEDEASHYPNCRTTTLGGILERHGRYSITTAAHILDQSIEACFADLGDGSDKLDGLDGSDGSIGPDEWDGSNGSDESMTTLATEVTSSNSILYFGAKEPRCNEDIKLQGSVITSAKTVNPLLGVVLFELHETELAHASDDNLAFQTLGVGNIPSTDISDAVQCHGAEPRPLHRLSPADEIGSNAGPIDVYTLTRNDLPVKGRLCTTSTLVTKCAGSEPQELWTVRWGKKLRKGDGGSWAVDVFDERVYGHVFAGNPATIFVYLVPFIGIQKFLGKHLGGEWHVLSSRHTLHEPTRSRLPGSTFPTRETPAV